jgi:hypothetical protein
MMCEEVRGASFPASSRVAVTVRRRGACLARHQQVRLSNWIKEALLGTAAAPPPSCERFDLPEPPPSGAHGSKRIQKDWRFYRRDGFLWTDLYHTPQARQTLVVNKHTEEGEKEFLRRLQRRLEEEDRKEEVLEAQKMKAVEQQRAAFRKQRERNAVKQQKISPPTPPAMPRSERVCRKAKQPASRPSEPSGRVGQLSRPKKRPLRVSPPSPRPAMPSSNPQAADEAFPSYLESSDTRGLLCCDPALVDLIPWHVQVRRREAQMAKHKQLIGSTITLATTMARGNSELSERERAEKERAIAEVASLQRYPPSLRNPHGDDSSEDEL